MLRRIIRSAVSAAIFIVIFATGIVFAPAPSAAQDHRQNAPGQFDFYVLALSWSPSYCESSRERRPNGRPDQQCGERPFSFVVHGLWPQYERGFPSFCQVPAPRLNRNIVGSMLDLMPSPRLVFHEWDRHGTCSGLTPYAYFENVRKARAVVKIPEQYIDVKTVLTVSAAEVREAFVKANRDLPEGAVSIDCSGKWLGEVRICMGKDFAFRECPEVTRRTCKRDRLVMPPVRGASASLN